VLAWYNPSPRARRQGSLGFSAALPALSVSADVPSKSLTPSRPPPWQHLRKGDVLMSVDGVKLANEGTIPFRRGERVELHYYFSQLFQDDLVKLEVLRDGQIVTFKVDYGASRQPSCLPIAGLVFSMLRHMHTIRSVMIRDI
jgi:hypothetical protein